MTEAIIYSRFSPRPNADESESCEKQEAVCKEYCENKKYVVTAMLQDKKCSGDDADRPGLWSAIKSLKKGMVLVVRWRNRLAREVYLSEVINRAVERAGARIEAAEEGSNGDTPQDKLIRQILAAFSEYEKRIRSIQTKYAMRKHQKNGRIMGSIPPYGMKRDPMDKKRLVPCREEQEAIAIMRELKGQGMTPYGIATELDMLGFKPKKAKEWSANVVDRILKRE